MGISPDILQPRKQLLFIFKLLYIIYIRAKLAHSTVAPQRLSADVHLMFSILMFMQLKRQTILLKPLLSLYELLLWTELFKHQRGHQRKGGNQSENSSHGFEPGRVARQKSQVVMQWQAQSHYNN